MLFLFDRAPGAETLTQDEIEWLRSGMTKICLRADSEDELRRIIAAAREAGLPVHPVTDAGKTEFRGVPTLTCCAIGPAEAGRIDAVTGLLRTL
jgi:PTH2 family peptidyl-tRNA hydrolase